MDMSRFGLELVQSDPVSAKYALTSISMEFVELLPHLSSAGTSVLQKLKADSEGQLGQH